MNSDAYLYIYIDVDVMYVYIDNISRFVYIYAPTYYVYIQMSRKIYIDALKQADGHNFEPLLEIAKNSLK